MNLYFKRGWDETTGDPLTDKWGTSIYFFETNQNGDVLRQLQIYENDRRLTYTEEYLQDEYGGLSKGNKDKKLALFFTIIFAGILP